MSRVLTVVRKLCGQLSTGPREVRDQSKSRHRCAISLPPTIQQYRSQVRAKMFSSFPGGSMPTAPAVPSGAAPPG